MIEVHLISSLPQPKDPVSEVLAVDQMPGVLLFGS
jgi:hypothetical protein